MRSQLHASIGVAFITLTTWHSAARAGDDSDELTRVREDNADPGAAPAGDVVAPDAAAAVSPFTWRALLQTRYEQTWPEGGGVLDRIEATDGNGYRLERAFLRLTAAPSKAVGLKLMVDFAELTRKNTRRALKLAFAQLQPAKRVEIDVGLFKRPFSLLELLPIADFELANVGVIDTLIKDLEFGGRDIGAQVRVEPLPKKKWLRLALGGFRGQAEDADASPAGVLVGRLTSKPVKHLQLGVDLAWHPTRSQVIDTGVATSGDVTLHLWQFELRAEGLWGTRDDLISRGTAHHFLGSWGLASYQIPIRSVILMPALRAEWLDLDRGHRGGAVTHLSGGLNLILRDGLRFLVDASVMRAQARAFKTDGTAYLNGKTVVAQVQLLL